MSIIKVQETVPFSSPADIRTPLSLSENQKKVIYDKYLKGGGTVEEWLSRVARNIALAELLYHPSSHLWNLFDGVKVTKRETPLPDSNLNETQHPANDKTPSKFVRTLLFHHGLASATEREINFQRFLENCEAATKKSPQAKALVEAWATRFYNLMRCWQFLPNSPTLMNAGRDLQQLSACYVLPIEDSMEGITHALQAQALIHKSGGGTGFSFGQLRPAGDSVKSTAGVASGVVSFMQVFDQMTGVVKQGGNRRGANMGILPYWHPEIKDFIRSKGRPGMMENFNISIAIDDNFLNCAENNLEYDIINPRTNKPIGKVQANEILDMIVENAWKSGYPGVIFIDRINNSFSNPTPALGAIEATNPCGEQPLLPNEPCNLGSINLSEFVGGEITRGQLNWDALRDVVHSAVRFLDDVIDVNNYPLPEMEILAKGNRRIGLGIMGWAETLVKMGLPYDSEAALELAGKVMKFINEEAFSASESLAQERGVFPNWRNSVYDPQGSFFRGSERRPRHCARTTIAPTGTIGLAAGLQGTGIEPFYALAYTRYNAQALDQIKQRLEPQPQDVFHEVNPLFRIVAEQHGYFGLTEEVLWQKIEKNRKSVRGIVEVPADIQALFATAYDVTPEFHIRIQAAFQTHTDNGVSKTVNLPHTATQEDVRRAFLLAHKQGCKGITIYRDGSRKQQVLNLSPSADKVKRARDLSVGVSSEYYEIKTGYGPLHVHIDFDEAGPYRIFASLPPVGSEISGLTSIVGVLVSKYLEEGGDPLRILKHLNAIKGDRPLGLGEGRVNSIPHAIAIALKSHLTKHGWMPPPKETEQELMRVPENAEEGPAANVLPLELWNLTSASDQCPKCYSSNVSFGAGCSGPLCHDCGYSECN